MACALCKGKTKWAKREFVSSWNSYKIRLTNVRKKVCKKCGAEFFSVDEVRLITKITASAAKNDLRVSSLDIDKLRESLQPKTKKDTVGA